MSTALRLGWFYTLTFHRVGLDITTGDTSSRLSIALLTGTGLVLWMLYRAGWAAGRVAEPSLWGRTLAGVMIAPVYAVPIGLFTLVTHLSLHVPAASPPDVARIHGVVWQAFVIPAAIAAVAGGVGGMLSGEPEGSRLRDWLVGGWRMLLLALGLALIGLLILSAVRPQGLRTYVHAVAANGPRGGALLLGHHALLLPNQSFMVLAPSMGACVSLEGPAATVPILCPGRLPVLGRDVSPTILAASRGAVPPAHRPMPAGYWLFLLVPAGATVLGGRWAAEHARGRERWIRSAGAGVVFGTLVGFGAWAACIGFRSFSFGPVPVPTGLLGLVWGVIGGTLGGLLPATQDGLGTPEPVFPPSPTSV